MKINIHKLLAIGILFILISYSLMNVQPYIYAGSNSLSSDISGIDTKKYPGIKESIQELQKQFPNWKFKILYTGLSWDDVIKNEEVGHGGSPKSLIYYTYTGEWRCSTCGDLHYDNGSWRHASEKAIGYLMDPRNILNGVNIFQFEDLTSDATYYLAANLGTLNSQITISKPIKLDGNGLTITRSTPTPTEGSPENWGTKAIVLINSDGVSISNLTVSGTTETAPSEWNDGEWGIKVYDAKGVTLSNITVQNVNAGIQVNSSAVTVSDAIEFDNTWFGGIGVDKGSTLDNYGTLNVANGTTFTMDITYKPTIYTETDDNAVEGAEATGLTAYRPTIAEKTNQKWYLSAAQYSELKDSVTAISADSTTSATE